jgi:membrane protease subunit HflC
MTGNIIKVGLIVVAIIAAVVLFSATFIVDQRQQALVLRFGGIRQVVFNPGLYFKVPMIENVVYIDKRILDLDLPPQEVIASDQKRLIVDTFTRYKVVDPLRFYQAVGSVVGANQRLTQIVNSATRATLADATFTSIVKNDRAHLMKRIRDEVNEQSRAPEGAKAQSKDREDQSLGIEIVDVRLRRVDLPNQNTEEAYNRMRTDRVREATEIRAQGDQIALGIKARADRDVTVIIAEATKRSEELRGEGDAERNRIFNDAFGKDHDFFAFYRSMQAYEAGLKSTDTRLLLSPDSDFFRYFTDPFGKSKNLSAPSGAAASGAAPSGAGGAAVPARQ